MTTSFGVRPTMRSEAARRILAAGLAFQKRMEAIEPTRSMNDRDARAPDKNQGRSGPATRPLNCREIIAEVAAKHSVPVADILSDGKSHAIIPARHEAMYRCVAETELSLPAIGRIFHRDHTSIGNAVMRHHIRTGAPLPRGMDWKAGRRKRR